MPRHTTLDRQRLLTKPRSDLWSETRGKSTVNVLVVGVEPVNLGAVEKILDKDRRVEVAESQRLESQPMAEIVLSGINAKDQVLVTDTELALPVYSRLITCDHSRNQSLTIEVLTDVLRPLVGILVLLRHVPSLS